MGSAEKEGQEFRLPEHDEIKAIVTTHLPVYDSRQEAGGSIFYVTADPSTIGDKFDGLRKELKGKRQIAMLRYQAGEHQILVIPELPVTPRGRNTNLLLLALTGITTTLAGAEAYVSYFHFDLLQPLAQTDILALFSVYWAPSSLAAGFVLFALPLLLISGTHEMGHYIMSRKHGLKASLPFFIPLPPFMALNIGTMGAFINIREPIPNRRALFDIGVAGPLVGFVVTIPVLLLGLFLQTRDPVTLPPIEGLGYLGTPLVYAALSAPFPLSDNQLIHPTAFAGWVGLVILGLNLMPAGHLDGGHISHALLGKNSIYLSYATMASLIVLGFGLPAIGDFPGFQGFAGWIFWALLIAILGLQHGETLDGVSGVDPRRVALGLAAFALLVVSFTPILFST